MALLVVAWSVEGHYAESMLCTVVCKLNVDDMVEARVINPTSVDQPNNKNSPSIDLTNGDQPVSALKKFSITGQT